MYLFCLSFQKTFGWIHVWSASAAKQLSVTFMKTQCTVNIFDDMSTACWFKTDHKMCLKNNILRTRASMEMLSTAFAEAAASPHYEEPCVIKLSKDWFDVVVSFFALFVAQESTCSHVWSRFNEVPKNCKAKHRHNKNVPSWFDWREDKLRRCCKGPGWIAFVFKKICLQNVSSLLLWLRCHLLLSCRLVVVWQFIKTEESVRCKPTRCS